MDGLFGGDPLDAIVDELRKFPDWQADDRKDRALAQQLLHEFPRLDAVAEIQNWRAWMLDHETKKEVRPRARVYRWFRTARGDFGRRSASRPARSERPSIAARPAAAFGESSADLGRW